VAALQPLLPGLSVEVLAAPTPSTNTAAAGALRAAGDATPRRRAQPCLLVAEHQTRGRGRLGRAWQSAPARR
jgi:BirA family transcriptional regulator, biotin operon repressor / biotin---[acetyl-CoA-carboxylase] ligase